MHRICCLTVQLYCNNVSGEVTQRNDAKIITNVRNIRMIWLCMMLKVSRMILKSESSPPYVAWTILMVSYQIGLSKLQ